MTGVKRLVSVLLLIIGVITATAVPRAAVAMGRDGHAAHGCRAAAPGGKAATIEPAGVAVAVYHAATAAGISSREGHAPAPPACVSPVREAFAFARPYDPPHLHASALLI